MQIVLEKQPKHFIMALHFSIRKVIEKKIPSPADIGFLMEILGKLAKLHDDTDWGKTKLLDVTLHEKETLACWHCLRICIDNKLVRNEEKQVFLTRAIFVVAKHLDLAKEEFNKMKEPKDLSLASSSE